MPVLPHQTTSPVRLSRARKRLPPMAILPQLPLSIGNIVTNNVSSANTGFFLYVYSNSLMERIWPFFSAAFVRTDTNRRGQGRGASRPTGTIAISRAE